MPSMNRLDHFQAYWHNVNETNATSPEGMLNLGMGMPPPDVFRTPRLLIEQLHHSIEAGDYNLYAPPEGDSEVLREIAAYENSLLGPGSPHYTEHNVMLVPGGIQAFSAILAALAPTDAPVLSPRPSYFSLSAQAERHAPTVPLPCSEDYNFLAEDVRLATADLDRLGLMWLCQPNNPTGLYVPPHELGQIIDLGAGHDCHLVLDESCDNYRFGPVEPPPPTISTSTVIRIKTFSKDPNFAGYRLGYLLADADVLARLKYVVPMIYGNPTVMATRAVLAEFHIRNGRVHDDGDHQETTVTNLAQMRESRDFLYSALQASDRVTEVIEPEACYYMFARLERV